MGSHRTTHGTAFGGATPDGYAARVVLIGRTGLDAKLRLDPDLELIRTRSPMDAIGEIANPVGGGAERTVVIVGLDADVGGRAGSPEEFVEAIRRFVPDAVVLGTADQNSPVSDAYGGVVDPNISTDRLRMLIHGDDGSIPEPVEHETPIFSTSNPLTEHAPKAEIELKAEPIGAELLSDDSGDDSFDASADLSEDASIDSSMDESVDEEPAAVHTDLRAVPSVPEQERVIAESTDPSPVNIGEQMVQMSMPISGAGDGSLVAALLGGRGVIEPAMDILRARVGRADIAFVPATDADASTKPGMLAVDFDGKRFGWLGTTNDPESLRPRSEPRAAGLETLEEHARWLAGWIALAEQQRRLRAEAMTDRVSGAWNRRYFDRFLEAAIAQARSQRRMLTVLVFDLDNFKQFNDELGHEAGDVILRETVGLMHSLTRPTDRICRIGGDEFAVIFYEPEGPRDEHSNHPTNFEAVAERFQRAVLEQRFPRLGIDAPGRLTISGGLATFPWDGNTPEELLRRADQLAMESKRAGKNSITFGSRNNKLG